jgi:hypothetical protein
MDVRRCFGPILVAAQAADLIGRSLSDRFVESSEPYREPCPKWGINGLLINDIELRVHPPGSSPVRARRFDQLKDRERMIQNGLIVSCRDVCSFRAIPSNGGNFCGPS